MTNTSEPFDEYPYLALPIMNTAPERLAVASAFHGGPRVSPLDARVLELGCANGANLLAMAWYRRGSEFVGIDGSSRQVEVAESSRKTLKLQNLRFHHADFGSASSRLEGEYDFIISHGVVSWVDDKTRHSLFGLCKNHLAPEGLVYLNYNCRPGWNIRGLVRQFLLRHTALAGDLQSRAEYCRELATRLISPLSEVTHYYTQLMANEFRLVARGHPAYLAHEYLAPVNNAWWQSEFLSMAGQYELEFIADADFNSVGNQSVDALTTVISEQGLSPEQVSDSVDLLSYEQMHSPVMTHTGFERKPLENAEMSRMLLASNLAFSGEKNKFLVPDVCEVNVNNDSVCEALLKLQPLWPRAVPLGELFSSLAEVREDVEFLVRNQFAELRCVEPGDFDVDPAPLHRLEAELRGQLTSPYHTISPIPGEPELA